MKRHALALAAILVAATVAGALTFSVATGSVAVLALQSQPAVACNTGNC
jgi:hypothetical protein